MSLAAGGSAAVRCRLGVNDLHGQAAAGIARTLARIMRCDAGIEIIGDAGIQRAVGTFEYVNAPAHRSLFVAVEVLVATPLFPVRFASLVLDSGVPITQIQRVGIADLRPNQAEIFRRVKYARVPAAPVGQPFFDFVLQRFAAHLRSCLFTSLINIPVSSQLTSCRRLYSGAFAHRQREVDCGCDARCSGQHAHHHNLVAHRDQWFDAGQYLPRHHSWQGYQSDRKQ